MSVIDHNRMFTGIVQGVGTIKQIQPKEDGYFFSIESSLFPPLKEGASVSIDGVCLTIVEKTGDTARFEVMAETVKKTAFEKKKEGDRVNIEPSLRLGDEMGGHVVMGHVDGVGRVIDRQEDADGVALTIEPPEGLMKYMAPRGSVAMNGVSLTIARTNKMAYTVFLIEYTLAHTTFGSIKKGDILNIEADMLAKYVEGLLEYKTS